MKIVSKLRHYANIMEKDKWYSCKDIDPGYESPGYYPHILASTDLSHLYTNYVGIIKRRGVAAIGKGPRYEYQMDHEKFLTSSQAFPSASSRASTPSGRPFRILSEENLNDSPKAKTGFRSLYQELKDLPDEFEMVIIRRRQ